MPCEYGSTVQVSETKLSVPYSGSITLKIFEGSTEIIRRSKLLVIELYIGHVLLSVENLPGRVGRRGSA